MLLHTNHFVRGNCFLHYPGDVEFWICQSLFLIMPFFSEIYCSGDLLHTIQMAKIFPDSKTFVDMKLKQPANITIKRFHAFLEQYNNKPPKDAVSRFVNVSFVIISQHSSNLNIQLGLLWYTAKLRWKRNGIHQINPNRLEEGAKVFGQHKRRKFTMVWQWVE